MGYWIGAFVNDFAMSEKLKPEELQTMLQQHDLILKGASGGKRIYLENKDLSGLKIFHGDLQMAVFRKCKLDGCQFTDTSFVRAEMMECSIKGAKFVRCRMNSLNLKGSDLTGTAFEGSNLFESYYNQAKIHEILMDGEEITLG